MECGKTIGITVYEDDTYERGHYFGEFTVPDEDSDGEYEKTGEWEGHDVVEWTGKEDSFEYWESTTVLIHEKTVSMEFHEFKQILEEEVGERSELSKGSYEVGRTLAHLPD
jgi:hypothetical protein